MLAAGGASYILRRNVDMKNASIRRPATLPNDLPTILTQPNRISAVSTYPLATPGMLRALIIGCALSSLITSAAPPTSGQDSGAVVKQALEQVKDTVSQGPFEDTWESLETYQIPEWYQDAKFGIFVHWGVYSVPAFGSEWYPRQMYVESDNPGPNDVYQHHRDTWGPQDQFGYKDFIPKFRAEHFDPDAWAKLFEASGARYVIPVAEHHDGFPMYDCTFTKWDAVEMGPQRDIIGELASSVRDRGMKFGVSSHRAFNWAFFLRREDFDTVDPEFEGLYGRSYPYLFTKEAKNHRSPWPPHDQQFKDDWLARTAELVDKYEPDIVWFDFCIAQDRSKSPAENPFAGHLKRFAAYYYNHAAEHDYSAIINYKWSAFSPKSAVLDLERSKMDDIRRPFWQTDTAVSSSSWGYTENQKYKPVDRLIDDLVDIVSKNGCLLLNVGPRPDGTIPQEDQDILVAMGDWLRVHGEAIYETRPWMTYGEGPTGTATGHLSESRNKPFTAQDIRFTTRENVLYAIGLGWPADSRAQIKSLGTDQALLDRKIATVSLLGSDGSIEWQHTGEGLSAKLPSTATSNYAYVLKIELEQQ